MSSPFIKQLAANERKTRDAALASLTKFLSSPRQFEDLELLKLWKGLFYCFWHSDRPLVQQALAGDLAKICLLVKENNFIPFLKAFWTTMCREWTSIDILRLDKFYTLLRKFTAAAFERLYKGNWNEKQTEQYVSLLESMPLSVSNAKMPNGIRYHLSDIYLEELSKVVPEEQQLDAPIEILIRPFEALLTKSPTKSVRLRVMKTVFEDKSLSKFGYESIADDDEGMRDTDRDNEHSEDGASSEDDDEDDEVDAADEEFTGFD